ncbi:hypothetical protein CR205_15880 [Alteribacter lacisalsi]|uniref:serine-type D-Ala-D-Ala carboxypeptidase n=1 Tax=Alteribacter lacisalsi TaxID=2045244 RepID=A0A2W0HG53_9BACI|nr:penicillin-binding transpeptidase domain-containing protein [Alteribacter lacisalsi]PYZ95862.1 hypothetical protein CR205_15880 [Alteribacter lacisalsi]
MIHNVRKIGLSAAAVSLMFVSACSDDEESFDLKNPDSVVESYTAAWENRDGERMADELNPDDLEEVTASEIDRAFNEIGETLGISSLTVTFESQRHIWEADEEEAEGEQETEPLTSLTYPVTIEMETMLGARDYRTDVYLTRSGEDEEWLVEWQADHIFTGMQEVTDRLELVTTGATSITRGEIFDRNGEGLAVNGEYVDVGFRFDRIKNLDEEVEKAAEILAMEESELKSRATYYEDDPDWFSPVMSMPMSDPRVEELQEAEIPGLLTSVQEGGRVYPYSYAAAHLTGFLTEIRADELEEAEWEGYHTHSLTAADGLEKYYEERLRGQLGEEMTIVDENGNYRELLTSTDPQDGEEIHLTINAGLQRSLADAMGDEAGSAVVMDPATGEVLALVSRPYYDPNQSYLGTSSRERERWMSDERGVITARFAQRYVPGSVVKPLTAAIGLEEGTLDPDEIIRIEGRDWQPEGDGWGDFRVRRVEEHTEDVDLRSAMLYSDNIYFAQQALEFGADTMEEWAEAFGFGKEVGLDFHITPSQLSNDELNRETLLADTAYGQGEMLMSTVHLASLYTMFVNGGDLVYPVLDLNETAETDTAIISSGTAETILETLYAVTEDRNGTAYRSNPGHSFRLAGKTGTAQLDGAEEDEEAEGDTIGWYVSTDAEDYIVAMMIEDETGGTVVDRVNDFWSRIE